MKALRRAIQFMQPYRTIVLFGLITTILPVIMELVVPRLMQYIVDQGIRASNMNAIYRGSALMFGSALLGALATLGQGFARAQLSQGIAFDMRTQLFTHIQSLSYADLDRMQTGQLMTRLSSDVDTVRMFSSAGLALLLRALLMIGGSMVMLFVTDWELASIMLVLLAIMGLILRTLLRTTQPLFVQVQQKLAKLNTIVQENLAGVRVVKAYVRERFEIDRFIDSSLDYRDQNIQVGRLMAMALPSLALFTNVGIVAIVWWGGASVIGGRLTVGELIAFNNYLMIGMAPLLLLSNMIMMVSRAEASAQRYFELIDSKPRIQRAATPYLGMDATPEASNGHGAGQSAENAVQERSSQTRTLPKRVMQGRVVFDKVSFHYDNRQNEEDDFAVDDNGFAPNHRNGAGSVVHAGRNDHHANDAAMDSSTVGPNGTGRQFANGAAHDPAINGITPNGTAANQYGTNAVEVLSQVSFAVEPGQQIALLGATGSGKSTLINLLPRFYDVTDGAILIDDVDVRQWAPEVLRSHIGMVLQESTLFSGTVRENIAYGRPDASMDEIIAAAIAAQAHDFISAMPDGYESIVEARGANLSGGQKQRVAIARALLIDPSILILDDSASALDFETEVRLQAALDKLMQGRTTFVVAQRISSVINADQILVLDGGHIAARGAHADLLASSPIYQDIYYSQLGEDAPA
ncbi:MAG: ABC transporter ATP-binding protein [Caldilineaceae bacterium]|nr:ABC transporter ATP-binding protein [Caldilineaceae bacterium]